MMLHMLGPCAVVVDARLVSPPWVRGLAQVISVPTLCEST